MTPQKVNEEVEMQNTETDSTLVTSDTCSSFLARSDNETGNASVKPPEKINLLVTTPRKGNEQVEMQNSETDSTLVTSSSLFLAESDLGKQAKEINSLKTAAKVNKPVEMQKNTEPDSTLATNDSSQFGKQMEEINPVVMTAPKVDELEMRMNTQTDSTSDGSSVASKHETDDEVGKKTYEISPLVTPAIKEENTLHNVKGDSFHRKSNHLQGMIDRLVRNRENMDGQEQSQIGVLADFASVAESERM